MDLNKVIYFCEIVQAGSIEKAAQRLNLTFSALKKSLLSLEKELGVQLFIRHRKNSLQLTEAGRLIYQSARKIYREKALIQNLSGLERQEPSGEIRIASTPATASVYLASLLPSFFEAYPKVRLKIKTDIGQMNFEQADVLIRTKMLHEPDLEQHYISTVTFKLWASKKYLEKFGTPQRPEDLFNHRILSFGDDRMRPYSNIDWQLRAGPHPGDMLESFLEINSAEGLLSLAEEGLGIVGLSDRHIALRKANVVQILPSFVGPPIDVYYIYPRYLNSSKAVIALRDYLVGPKNQHIKKV